MKAKRETEWLFFFLLPLLGKTTNPFFSFFEKKDKRAEKLLRIPKRTRKKEKKPHHILALIYAALSRCGEIERWPLNPPEEEYTRCIVIRDNGATSTEGHRISQSAALLFSQRDSFHGGVIWVYDASPS